MAKGFTKRDVRDFVLDQLREQDLYHRSDPNDARVAVSWAERGIYSDTPIELTLRPGRPNNFEMHFGGETFIVTVSKPRIAKEQP